MSDITCLICLGKATVGRKSHGDISHVVCPRCGEYFIDGSSAAALQNQIAAGCPQLGAEGSRKRATASGFVYENRQMAILSFDDFEKLEGIPMPSFQSRAERLMLALEKETEFAGQFVPVHLVQWLGRTWCMNDNELKEMILSHETQGFLEREQKVHSAGAPPIIGLKVTPQGWVYLEKLKEKNPLSRQGFVAMWFNPCMTPTYEEAIAPAIRDAGYEPKRIDKKEHFGKIDDAIIAEIRRSRFVVADFTGHRAGVYYEAGFAHGLNIPVIFTCRNKELHKLHFDVRQYITINWETPEDLRARLTQRITASPLGYGPMAGHVLP